EVWRIALAGRRGGLLAFPRAKRPGLTESALQAARYVSILANAVTLKVSLDGAIVSLHAPGPSEFCHRFTMDGSYYLGQATQLSACWSLAACIFSACKQIRAATATLSI